MSQLLCIHVFTSMRSQPGHEPDVLITCVKYKELYPGYKESALYTCVQYEELPGYEPRGVLHTCVQYEELAWI